MRAQELGDVLVGERLIEIERLTEVQRDGGGKPGLRDGAEARKAAQRAQVAAKFGLAPSILFAPDQLHATRLPRRRGEGEHRTRLIAANQDGRDLDRRAGAARAYQIAAVVVEHLGPRIRDEYGGQWVQVRCHP